MLHMGDDDRENPTPVVGPGSRPSSRQTDSEQQWEMLAMTPEEEDAYLLELAGVESLDDATSLQVAVNTNISSISHLGSKLCKLQELNLNHSVLDSLRDLGTSFKVLQVLWISRCGLQALDGVSGLPALRELYASFNDISDLQPLDSCVVLEVLDIEGNCVAEIDTLHYLQPCTSLQSLTLTGNPVADVPEYRQQVLQILSGLQSLDDVTVCDQDRQPPSLPSSLSAAPVASSATSLSTPAPAQPGSQQAELALVREGIKHARVGVDSQEFKEMEMSMLLAEETGEGGPDARPSSASIMPVNASSWIRTLRSSQQGSLAALRQSQQLPRSPLAASSPVGSRPVSAQGQQDAANGGGSSSILARPSSGHRPSSSSSQPGRPGTCRPFSARPGSGSTSIAARLQTASAPSTSSSLGGLYWRKNRLGSGGKGRNKGGAGTGVVAELLGEEGQRDAGSSLTYGTGSAFGGSLVRDLKKWKGGKAGGGPHSSSSGTTTPPTAAGGGAAGSEGAGKDESARGPAAAGAGKPSGASHQPLDHQALLEELRVWKLETADKALQYEEETSMAWLSEDASGGPGDQGDTSADILELAELDGEGEAPGPVHVPRGYDREAEAVLQPVHTPTRAVVPPCVAGTPSEAQPLAEVRDGKRAGGQKMMLLKVVRDMGPGAIAGMAQSPSRLAPQPLLPMDLSNLNPIKVGPHLQAQAQAHVLSATPTKHAAGDELTPSKARRPLSHDEQRHHPSPLHHSLDSQLQGLPGDLTVSGGRHAGGSVSGSGFHITSVSGEVDLMAVNPRPIPRPDAPSESDDDDLGDY